MSVPSPRNLKFACLSGPHPDVADAGWSDEPRTLFDSRLACKRCRSRPCPGHDELVENRQLEQLVEARRRLRGREALA
jgi:hypothetical protein